jgi:hypothetical protein
MKISSKDMGAAQTANCGTQPKVPENSVVHCHCMRITVYCESLFEYRLPRRKPSPTSVIFAHDLRHHESSGSAVMRVTNSGGLCRFDAGYRIYGDSVHWTGSHLHVRSGFSPFFSRTYDFGLGDSSLANM